MSTNNKAQRTLSSFLGSIRAIAEKELNGNYLSSVFQYFYSTNIKGSLTMHEYKMKTLKQ